VGFSCIPMLIQHGFIKVENHRVSAPCIFNFMRTGLVVNAENKNNYMGLISRPIPPHKKGIRMNNCTNPYCGLKIIHTSLFCLINSETNLASRDQQMHLSD